jgi:hypothetical protein
MLQVRDVCTILNMRQSDFVVRAEEKSLSWFQHTTKLSQPTEGRSSHFQLSFGIFN